jgi:hypothetical protein
VNISMAPATDAEKQARYTNNELDIALSGRSRCVRKGPGPVTALTRLDEFSVNFLTLIRAGIRRSKTCACERRSRWRSAGPRLPRLACWCKPSTSLVPSTLPGFDAGVGFQGNIAKARQLMAAAGYPWWQGLSDLLRS